MQFLKNHSLKPYNTFGVDVVASYFAVAESVADLQAILHKANAEKLNILPIGGGSNMLLVSDFEDLVVKIAIEGIEAEEKDDTVWITAGAGVVWNDFVHICVNEGYAGIENLTLIPGTVGAAPIQNIGAYGVELKDVFHSLTAVEIATGKAKKFNKEQCAFGYRDSVFKNDLKNKYIITDVTLELNLHPEINTSYGAIKTELDAMKVSHIGIAEVSTAVSNIRSSKLPDPKKIGNCGSFFKNPIVSKAEFEKVKAINENVVNYSGEGDSVKLAAGWLIEQCGWKGKSIGNVSTWHQQALVIVSNGQATGKEIFDFSESIIQSVNTAFGIKLEREVNII